MKGYSHLVQEMPSRWFHRERSQLLRPGQGLTLTHYCPSYQDATNDMKWPKRHGILNFQTLSYDHFKLNRCAHAFESRKEYFRPKARIKALHDQFIGRLYICKPEKDNNIPCGVSCGARWQWLMYLSLQEIVPCKRPIHKNHLHVAKQLLNLKLSMHKNLKFILVQVIWW